MTAPAFNPDRDQRLREVILDVARAHRLYRCMAMAQASALRHSSEGRHRLASQRWGLLLELHVTRQGILRKWGLL